MFPALVALLPLLAALPLSVAQPTAGDASLHARSWYNGVSDAVVDTTTTDASDAHGHGAGSFRRGHASGVRRRRAHGGAPTAQKLVRRRKDDAEKRADEGVKLEKKSKGKKRSCKAKTTASSTALGTAAASATSAVTSETGSNSTLSAAQQYATASLASSASSAVTSSSSAAAAHVTNYAVSSSATATATASASNASGNATASSTASVYDSDPELSGNSTSTDGIDIFTTYTVPESASVSATATSTSSAANATSTAVSYLFPWGTGLQSWTTSEGALSCESALKPLTAGKLGTVGAAPDGSDAIYASFPKDSVGLTSSGFSFYTQGAHSGVEVDNASEVMLSYSVYFEDGFMFNKGGKMPGLYGGQTLAQAKSCSGGRQTGRDSCFSARLMWRTDGAGEIYDYLPVSYTGTDDGYGESIKRGAYTWATGKWQTVAIRVKLNDVGSANGEQELVVDGQSVISLTGVTFRTAEDTKVYGIMAQTFFGGHTSDWASPQDQKLYFKDWTLGVLA
ncbi:hypothetical protein IAT38_006670 [Cryptococcus sp. DSM 104549]